MKKILLGLAFLPFLGFAQESNRKEIHEPQVRKGFYVNYTNNFTSPFDNTFNGKISGGMHFDGFHVGAHLLTSYGNTRSETGNPTTITPANEVPKYMDMNYLGYGLDLMYEVEATEKFSVAPYLSMGLVNLEYVDYEKDRFLNTQFGGKFLFAPNKNIKLGLDVGYSFAKGADLGVYTDDHFNGLNFGLTLQYNHFFAKW
jgi:hypothetical protein